jgi:D-3-phosphoglycerate dehydrogenase
MSKKISILITEPMATEGLALLNSHQEFDVKVFLNPSHDDLVKLIVNYDCLLVRSQTKVDREIIEAGKKLRLIGRAGVGIDNIDILSAKEFKITVINTPLGNSISTAELAFALILSLARKIPFAHIHVHEGKWDRSAFKGMEIYQKTLGIVGMGNVGKQLAVRAKAFGMSVWGYDPFVNEATCQELGIHFGTKEDVFARADFLSLHCGLTETTKNFINERSLAMMKPGAFLINAARGELIDDQALITALNQGRIGGAAIDVFRHEPPALSNPLLKHEKIILTPHLGASTTEAQLRVSTLLAEQTINFFTRGGETIPVV